MGEILQHVPEAFDDMPGWYSGYYFTIGVLVLASLLGYLIYRLSTRPRQLKHRAAAISSLLLKNVLSASSGVAEDSAGVVTDVFRFASPKWEQWETGGYVAPHPLFDELVGAVVDCARDDRAANVIAVVGESASGKTVLACSVGRKFVTRARGPWVVYMTRPTAFAADLSASLDALDAACELARSRRSGGVLLIIDDGHADWKATHRICTTVVQDSRFRDAVVLLTLRAMPKQQPNPALLGWYESLDKLNVGGDEQYEVMAANIAQRMCQYSLTDPAMPDLEWTRLEPLVAGWLGATKRSLLEWVVLLATIQEVADTYEVNRDRVLDHVLAELDRLRTNDYPQLQARYNASPGVDPQTVVVAVSMLFADRSNPVSASFVMKALGCKKPMLDELLAAGVLVGTNRHGALFLELPHVGVAELIRDAVSRGTSPPECWCEVKDAIKAYGVDPQVLRPPPAAVAWLAYLSYVLGSEDVAAFAALCERITLWSCRYMLRPIARPGVLFHVRWDVRIGPDPSSTQTDNMPNNGDRPSLGRVSFRQPSGESLVRPFKGPAELRRLDELCQRVYSQIGGIAGAGALLLALRLGGSGWCDILADALTSNDSVDVRYVAAWGIGSKKLASSVPALAHALRQDTSRSVRATAAWALGEIGDTNGTVAALIDGFDDPDEW